MEFELSAAIIVARTTGSPFDPKFFSQTINLSLDRSSVHFYHHNDFASVIPLVLKGSHLGQLAKSVLLFLTKRDTFRPNMYLLAS